MMTPTSAPTAYQLRTEAAIRKFKSASTPGDKASAHRELLVLKSEIEGLAAVDAIRKSQARGQPIAKLWR
jgi:ribosomal protein S20